MRGVNRDMQICRSMLFFAKSVDPPMKIFVQMQNRNHLGIEVQEGNMLDDYVT